MNATKTEESTPNQERNLKEPRPQAYASPKAREDVVKQVDHAAIAHQPAVEKALKAVHQDLTQDNAVELIKEVVIAAGATQFRSTNRENDPIHNAISEIVRVSKNYHGDKLRQRLALIIVPLVRKVSPCVYSNRPTVIPDPETFVHDETLLHEMVSNLHDQNWVLQIDRQADVPIKQMMRTYCMQMLRQTQKR